MFLTELVTINSGQPQFRLSETSDLDAPSYTYYTQANLELDVQLADTPILSDKVIRTFDPITSLLSAGDVIFSLISGKSARVSNMHQGFLYTQNYVKLTPTEKIDANYLIYLLNESTLIQKQLTNGLQGTQVLKYTMKQLKSLKLPKLPALSKQRLIGDIYCKQQKLAYLKQRAAKLETFLVLHQLQKASSK
ncbi:restriction endonuclease subunit S [Pasteurella multocida]|uniref:restriction endonuclease subunit S n=1 Tax=Pasteurella multocida TaxID=747 RepID=UPI0020216679|nr:restriction endonuclease subunit S [Pasteurella multocida]MCL7825697.1 restriction endonuclease subunit S [Pasteurella multocida]URI04053.1 restriction endonuclease subunit S [Pasteurella multocida]HDR1315119.1 restriction endonuclease subunit S [Pasteurella multocida]